MMVLTVQLLLKKGSCLGPCPSKTVKQRYAHNAARRAARREWKRTDAPRAQAMDASRVLGTLRAHCDRLEIELKELDADIEEAKMMVSGARAARAAGSSCRRQLVRARMRNPAGRVGVKPVAVPPSEHAGLLARAGGPQWQAAGGASRVSAAAAGGQGGKAARDGAKFVRSREHVRQGGIPARGIATHHPVEAGSSVVNAQEVGQRRQGHSCDNQQPHPAIRLPPRSQSAQASAVIRRGRLSFDITASAS